MAGCRSSRYCLRWTISPGNAVGMIRSSRFLTGDGTRLGRFLAFWPWGLMSGSVLCCRLARNRVYLSGEMQAREKIPHVALTLWVKSIQWKQESLSSQFPWRFLNSCQVSTNRGVPDQELVFQSLSPRIIWAHSKCGHCRKAKLTHSKTVYLAFSWNVNNKVSKEYFVSVYGMVTQTIFVKLPSMSLTWGKQKW